MGAWGTGIWGASSWGGGWVPTLPCDTGIESDMFDLLLSQYAGKPRMQVVIKALAERVQEAECLEWEVILELLLDVAEGVQLDLYGKLLGQDRLGLGDEEYRNMLRARILSNLTEGEVWRLTKVLWMLLGGVDSSVVNVWYRTLYPAGFYFQDIVDTWPSSYYQGVIANWMESITPAGVGLYAIIIAMYAPPTTTFFSWGAKSDPATPLVAGGLGWGGKNTVDNASPTFDTDPDGYGGVWAKDLMAFTD